MMTLTPDQESWLQRMQERQARPPRKTARTAPVEVVKECVFTAEEIAWLWPRFQKLRHRTLSFSQRFAKTPLDRLTAKGKAILAETAFPYRRQLFARSEKWDLSRFIAAIKEAAGGGVNAEPNRTEL